MMLLARVTSFVRALTGRRRRDREMDAEWQFHLAERTAALEAAGLSQAEAARRARIEFGDPLRWKEQGREASGLRWLHDLRADAHYAIRQMRRAPGFAAVAIATLALGIGATTAIVSVVNSLLLRPLPVADPERLVTVSSARAINGGFTAAWSHPVWDQIRQRAQTFDGALAWSAERLNLAGRGEKQLVDGLYVSGDFFTTLGVPAVVGRTFTSADDVRGGGTNGPTAVIGYGLWQRRFGGAVTAIGTPLLIEDVRFTVVGVAPREFFGAEVGRSFDVAIPISAEPLIRGEGTFTGPGAAFLTIMLRLKPGQSIDEADATVRGLQPQIREATLPKNASKFVLDRYLADPFTLLSAANGDSTLRRRYGRPLVAMMVVVALVLLIACANIANLLLARMTAREHELSVRLAIGAPRWRLARQLLIESLVLAAGGAAAGLLVAAWGSQALVAQLPSDNYSGVFLDVSPNGRVLAFTVLVTVATALLFGTLPAFRATRAAPIEALKERGRGLSGHGRSHLSSGLVVAQMALSLILVVAAGLFIRTFVRLANLPLGFDSDRVLVVNLDAPRAPLDVEYRFRLYERLIAAVSALPGVAHAAGSIITPISSSGMNLPVDVSGAPPAAERDRPVLLNFVTPGWLATYGTALRAGRDLDERDSRNGPPVALVNEAFVRRFFPNRSAIGSTVTYARFLKFGGAPKTVVGVVADAVYLTLRDEVQPTMYVPLAQWDIPRPMNDVRISIRSAGGSPAMLASSVSATLTAADSDLVFTFRPLAAYVDTALAQERLVARLSGFFGALALLPAGIGLYGVTSYAVARRRAEIGIRLALGAEPNRVVRLVLTRVAWLVSVGLVAGVAASMWLSRFIAPLLYGLEPRDPATLVGAMVTLAAVGALAGWLPARRAARTDPADVLRAN